MVCWCTFIYWLRAAIRRTCTCVWSSCEFHGTAAELASHVESCPYEAIKHYISRSEAQFSDLVKMLQHKDQEISFLQAMLGQLSNKVESLQKTLEGHYLFSFHCFITVSFRL